MPMPTRTSGTAPYFPDVAVPLVLVGIGMGMALTPLTTAGIAGVDPDDAGAASGVVNAAHQLGGSLGLSVLVTVFASASRSAAAHPLPGASAPVQAHYVLTHGVAGALTGSTLFLGVALAVCLIARRPLRLGAATVRQAVRLSAR
jgi:hypothetical protein